MNYKNLNVKLHFDILIDERIANQFRMLAMYKQQLALLKRTEPEHKVLSEQLKELRKIMKEEHHSQYRIRYQKGSLYNELIYWQLPEPLGFKEVVDEFIHDIKEIRASLKHVSKERKSLLGFQYETIGGVFKADTKEGIIQIGKNTDPFTRLGRAKVPNERIKANYVGIELELMSRVERNELSRRFVDASLAGYVYPKSDGSIRVEDSNETGHEITVLCRQENVDEIIGKVCKVLNSSGVASKVNNSCGFHLHIDMRNRDPYNAYNNLVKALPLLNRMIPSIRFKDKDVSHFCKQNQVKDLKEYFPDPKNIKGTRLTRDSRYQAINPYSLLSHNTIEVRLHSGTTNAKKITMWTKICVALADATILTHEIKTVEEFEALVLKDDKISTYMRERIELFEKHKEVDTRADYVLDSLHKEVV